MKKKLNIIFFGICFLAALIGEIFCIQVLKGDLFSTLGIGLVVLITGFLFMETIQSNVNAGRENTKFYINQIFQEEHEKWLERYMQLLDLQKATYSATKKNAARLDSEFDELRSRLEEIETNNSKALQKITELLKKSMEGQKNALKLEIKDNRDNTKQIIEAITRDEKTSESEQLAKILELLQENRELLSSKEILVNKMKQQDVSIVMNENAPEPIVSQIEEQQPEALDFVDMEANEPSTDMDQPEEIKVTPLYADPNKNLSPDEIAALFASVSK